MSNKKRQTPEGSALLGKLGEKNQIAAALVIWS